MDSELRGLQHGYLNAIHAGLQGLYTRLNVLEKFSAKGADPAYKQQIIQTLGRIVQLYRAFWQGEERDMRSTSDMEVQFILHTAEELRRMYVENAAAGLALKEYDSISSGDLDFIVAQCAEQAYSREHFVKGLIQYGDVFQAPEVADRWRNHLLSCQQEIAIANRYFQLTLDKNLSDHDRIELVSLHEFIPYTNRTKAVDVLVLDSIRKKSDSPEIFDFTGDELVEWEKLGLDVIGASYWRAYTFAPQEALKWLTVGFRDPALAAGYYVRGIDCELALAWIGLGIQGASAAEYQAQGIFPENYETHIQ